jgi:AcrR family transcriptional regulator
MTGRDRMRTDKARNHETILTSAITVLAADPEASMHRIAEASGIGRTTLYRHFPDRQALIDAILDRALSDVNQIVDEALDAAGNQDPVTVMANLCVDLAGLGDRYRFLDRHATSAQRVIRTSTTGAEARGERYLSTAQREHRIRTDLAANWLRAATAALITAGAEYPFPNPAARNDAIRATITSLLHPPREPDPPDPER